MLIPQNHGQPVSRVELMDVARGFAILGILGLNIFIFALPFEAMIIPGVWGEHNLANTLVWETAVIWFSGVMRGMISILFGAAAYLMLMRAQGAADGFGELDRYFRRLLLLIVFGLIHSYVLLWPHDILFVYGVIGLLLFPFRNLPVKTLLVMVAVMVFASSVLTAENQSEIAAASETLEQELSEEELQQLRDAEPLMEEFDGSLLTPIPGLQLTVQMADAGSVMAQNTVQSDAVQEDLAAPSQEDLSGIEAIAKSINDEIEQRQQGYISNFFAFAPLSLAQQTEEMATNHLLDIGTFFLLGFALFKNGFLTGKLHTAVYLRIAVIGYAIGLTIGFLGRMDVEDAGLLQNLSALADGYGYDYRRLLLALANLASLALILRFGIAPWFNGILSKCGRMALSLYVLQTVMCNGLFLGSGLGLFGALEHYEIGILFLVLTLFQIWLASFWLSRFKQGPLEKILRLLIEFKTPTSAPSGALAK
ncbi:DUF418 domain-containing protein [Pseudahrensia aquimaris]|uniref:DUF418 domain-containing protein n=1 Tax=Pseudahrensia aquimaris TaxID=744461 RepID=A0ABW3FB48_9HYPH